MSNTGSSSSSGGGRGSTPLRGEEAAKAAEDLGFTKRIPPQKAPFNSHGQPVFQAGNKYITPDVDGHSGGVWKMFDRNGTRLGTYDAKLVRIGN
jgi:filamentous hemagglutinin